MMPSAKKAKQNNNYQFLQRLCTASEMQGMDRRAIQEIGIPGIVLMENAARSVSDWVEQHYLKAQPHLNIIVCCGKGNNGGDGYAIARLLKNRGYNVTVLNAGEAKTEDGKRNQILWGKFGKSVNFTSKAAQSILKDAELILDAIFGTGLERPIEGDYRSWIEKINKNTDAIKIGVDIPSGIHSDHGQVLGVAVECLHTITFQVGKQGAFQYPGAQFAGELVVTDISIPPNWPEKSSPTYLLTKPFIQKLLPRRTVAANKGSYGHLLTICGSSGMAGAALLTSFAAIKTGSGLVSACVPLALRDAFLGQCPEVMTLSPKTGSQHYFSSSHLAYVEAEIEKRDAVVLGCGLGQTPQTVKFVRHLLTSIEKPLLLDADGLNSISGKLLAKRSGPTVITPHPRELSRLCGIPVAEIQEKRVETTRKLAEDWGVVILLKGAHTVISDPEGNVFINPTGNEGMATGGSGDVLSGIIGSFMAQKCSPLEAALLGAYLHGLSGDCLRTSLSSSFLSASDLIQGLNQARQLLK
ncbi:MAG: NAD(P)H-hydrate dehydratase [SAR324 cluster bacterium]|nr:NAD(P)H-hydrate dehydratase [SAR324 cluster bacterium]